MPRCFKAHIEVLPAAQREIWPSLRALPQLSFVLYGGTAVALYFGHRESLDFDFFRAEALDKSGLRKALPLLSNATIIHDGIDTLAASVAMPAGPVKLSFFGGIGFGRVGDPMQTADGALLVASIDDLMATKLKATLDRAEARDYRDLATMLRHGASLERGLAAFKAMFKGEPATVLRALGWFKDGDVASLDEQDRKILLAARDRLGDLPPIAIAAVPLAVPMGDCDEMVEFPLAASR